MENQMISTKNWRLISKLGKLVKLWQKFTTDVGKIGILI